MEAYVFILKLNSFIKMRIFSPKFRHYVRKKKRQSHRISHKSVEFTCLLIGAALVALVSFGFAQLANWGLALNHSWVAKYPRAVWIVLPIGLAILAWFTRKYAPFVSGSGIPQVIASINLPHGPHKGYLVRFWQTLWKIPLTFLAMIIGGSVGREGPSVQVGAAVMLAWGNFCRRHGLAFSGLTANELIATGAAGGLAAAFNAPLAGVMFAIEELGRGVALRWERKILLGVLACGFILIAIAGNNPYFPHYHGAVEVPYFILWVAGCGVVCGVLGGLFAKLLAKGVVAVSPARIRGWVRRHPVMVAFILGLILAAIGTVAQGQTYGTGYGVVAQALDGNSVADNLGIWKLLATVGTYWSGVAGGIFTPCLTTGAGIGMQIWSLTGGIIDQRLLVLMCMAAFLAGATQSPVTASVVVMEMTGSQPVLFWMLLCSIGASIISRQFNPKPFYHFAAGRFRQRVQELAKEESELKNNNEAQQKA